jgi:pyruvate, orthophosphate dikinase
MIPRAAQSFDLSASYQSRCDDSSKFLDDYLRRGIYKKDPFQELDTEGVGSLMRIAIERGRKAKKRLTIGICGEHGGDPASVKFCHSLGLDYVSCSPFRLPVARWPPPRLRWRPANPGASSRTFDVSKVFA